MKDMRVSAHDRKLFDRAAGIARYGEHERVKVGAILTRGRTMIGRAHNRTSVAVEPFKEGHAERRVIDGQPAIKGTLYVARLGLNWEGNGPVKLNSFPCDECMAHIVACACVSKIVFWKDGELRKVRL